MDDLKIYLSAPPEFAAEAAGRGPVSLMGWRVGRGFRLYRAAMPQIRACLMDVDCAGFTGYGPQESLAEDLCRECCLWGCRGLSLDLPRPTPPLLAFCGVLAEAAERRGMTLYLPEPYARVSRSVHLVLPAQNLSGTFRGRMARLAELYGPERLAPELERVTTDFPLPCRTSRGSVLSPRSAAALPRNPTFRSPELAANTMSYISQNRTHLVLWDDADTLQEKISVMKDLGIREAFVYYPHIRDLIGK